MLVPPNMLAAADGQAGARMSVEHLELRIGNG